MAPEVAAGHASKTALRKEVLAARDALAPAQRREWSAAITAQLVALDAYCNARCILAYMSFGSEFDTAALIADALAARKALCLPRVDRATRRLTVHRVHDVASELQAGTWGIREPRAECAPADLAQIDLVLVPGVAFTPRCERLGYGGGFYDRLIPQFELRPALVAPAFDMQLREHVPTDASDQRVDVVITESAFYCNC